MFLCFNDCYAKICIKRTCKYYIPFCTYEHCEWARCVDSQPGWSGPVTMVTMWVTCVWSPLTWYTVVIGLQGTSLQPAAVPGILGSEVQRARVGSCWSHWTMTDPVCGEATLPAASLHRGWVMLHGSGDLAAWWPWRLPPLLCLPHSGRVMQLAGNANRSEGFSHIEGILQKGPYLLCVSMAGRALLAGYHR